MENVPALIERVLRQEIQDGVALPGSSLSQMQLAARFGVSRVPVREALCRLEAEGLISQAPHKRARVASLLDGAVLRESLEIRDAIEPALMRHALHHVSNDVLDRAVEALQVLNAEQSIANLKGLHGDFHSMIYDCAQRPQMASIVSSHRYRLDTDPAKEVKALRAYVEATKPVHTALLRACYNRDVEAALACVRDENEILRAALFAGRREAL